MSLTSLLPWPKTFAAHLRKKRCDYNFFFPVQTVALFIFLPNLCVLVIIMIQTHIHTPFTMKLSIVYKISLWIVAPTLEPCGDNTHRKFFFFSSFVIGAIMVWFLFFSFLKQLFCLPPLVGRFFFFSVRGKGPNLYRRLSPEFVLFSFLSLVMGERSNWCGGRREKKPLVD
jgi:hypothetical protein